jgi:DNA invertase Pin-like site-specific DNA recombinase
MFNMLATIAQFETEIRAERQIDGIRKAKASGVVFGRIKTLTPDQVTELKSKRQSGILIKDLMAEYRLSKKSIYNYLELSKAFEGGARGVGYPIKTKEDLISI